MVFEQQKTWSADGEKAAILARSPLTVIFLSGDLRDPDWATELFRASDFIRNNIDTILGAQMKRSYPVITPDHSSVLLSIGFELATDRNTAILLPDITKKVVALGWIRPEEVKAVGNGETEEHIVDVILAAGMILNLAYDIKMAFGEISGLDK